MRVHGHRTGGGPESENCEEPGIGAMGLERPGRGECGRSILSRKHSKGTLIKKKRTIFSTAARPKSSRVREVAGGSNS